MRRLDSAVLDTRPHEQGTARSVGVSVSTSGTAPLGRPSAMKPRHAVTAVAVALPLTPVVLLAALLLIPAALALIAAIPVLGMAGLPALPRIARATQRAASCAPSLPAMRTYSRAAGPKAQRTAAPAMSA